MRKLAYNDEWILCACDKYNSFRELAKAHNERFGTNFTRAQMKNHASLILGVRYGNYWYTEDMEQWIRSEFPKTGSAEEKVQMFNARFNTNRSEHCLREKAKRMGVTLSEEAKAEFKRKSAEHLVWFNTTVRAKPIGYIGRPSNGYLMVKTAEGWISQARYEYTKAHGDIKSDYVVIFLDGNVKNVNHDNLMAIPQRWQALMTAHKLWSEHPIITKTAIEWCELFEILHCTE